MIFVPEELITEVNQALPEVQADFYHVIIDANLEDPRGADYYDRYLPASEDLTHYVDDIADMAWYRANNNSVPEDEPFAPQSVERAVRKGINMGYLFGKEVLGNG